MKDKGKDFSIEPIDIDINKLFSLSYTFDNLKSFMNKLLDNQNVMANKINELSKKCKHGEAETKKLQSVIIPTMDKKLKILESTIAKRKKESKKKETEFSEEKSEKKQEKRSEIKKETRKETRKETKKETKKENIDENLEKKEKENENIQKNEDENLQKTEKPSSSKPEIEKVSKKNNESSESNFENDEESSNFDIHDDEELELKERISALEQQVNSLENQISKKKSVNFGQSLDSNKGDVEFLKLEFKNLTEKYDEFMSEKTVMNKKMDEILIKVTDFDIYDLLGECKLSDGSIDVTKLLVKNLEEKVFKKTNIIDDKIRKIENDMYKTKSDTQTIKNQSEALTTNFADIKNTMQQFAEEIQKTLDVSLKKTDDDIKENHKKILQRLEDEKNSNKKNFDKIKQQIKSILSGKNNNNEDYTIKNVEGGLSDKDLKLMGDFSKRVSELEKQTKNILNILEISKNKGDIARLENEINQKTNQKDFFELSDKMNLTNTNLNNLRDMIDRVSDISNKNMNDLNYFLKKIESLSAAVLEVNTSLENLASMKDENAFDPELYMSVETFNEFIKAYHRTNKILERSIDELRRMLNDFGNVLKTKSSEEDMKNFDIIYNNKLEELKLMCGKKFSDKNDTNKTYKYLDAQIKHILEMLTKKNDKNENWLLAKKQVGYCCASCETYLGDLKESGGYIPWNKYPNREKEKNYRVGNGFSRMLNMLNLDVKSSVDNIKEISMEENDEKNNYINTIPASPHLKTTTCVNSDSMKNIKNNKFNKSNLLPMITKSESITNINEKKVLNNINNNLLKGRNKTTDNFNNVMSQSDMDTIDKNENGPHIVRVIKKNKLV